MDCIAQFAKDTGRNCLPPIKPMHKFPVSNVVDAVRFMRKGDHIGKIVIEMPDDPAELVAVNGEETCLLSKTSTYLLVGGLGGLGRATASWMVAMGARKFCFLSRSAGDSELDKAFIAELESRGCEAVTVKGNVSILDDVKKAIRLSPSKIAGVVQLSMVTQVSFSVANWLYFPWQS